MTRLNQERIASGKRILLVDDLEDYRLVTLSLLQKEGHEVIAASSGDEALTLLRQQHFDLVLLDYYMPGGITGENVVEELRKFNQYVQVILQTGYSGEYPPREMLRRLDIQGYHDKTDGPEKLLLWVDVGLKMAYAVQLLYKSRQGLRYILDATPDLHKIQTLDNLLQGILWQVTGLLGTVNSFLAVLPEEKGISCGDRQSDAFLAMYEEEANLEIHVATGRFSNCEKLENSLEALKMKLILEKLQKPEAYFADDYTVIPLRIGGQILGVIFMEQKINHREDIELLEIFANQAAVAIQNTRLYTIATNDQLTGVYVRRFFEQWLLRELRTAFRLQQPLSLLMIDLDGLKHINDTAGHLAGDQALAAIGGVLRKATRATDFIGRYGGDEFAVLLPQTSIDGASAVIKRIMEFLQDKIVEGPNGRIPIKCSIGICGVNIQKFKEQDIPKPTPQSYFEEAAKALIQRADEMLYQAKHSGGSCVRIGTELEWQSLKEDQ